MERRFEKQPLVAGRMSDLTLRSAVFMAQEHGLEINDSVETMLGQLLNTTSRADVSREHTEEISSQSEKLKEGTAISPKVLEVAQAVFHDAPPDDAQYFNHLEAATLGAQLVQEIVNQHQDVGPSDYVQGIWQALPRH